MAPADAQSSAWGLLLHCKGLGWHQELRRCCALLSSLCRSPNPPGYHWWLGTAAWGRGRLPSTPTGRRSKPLSFTVIKFKNSYVSWGKSSFHEAPRPCSSTSLTQAPASLCKPVTSFLLFQSVFPPKTFFSQRHAPQRGGRSHQRCFVPALLFPQRKNHISIKPFKVTPSQPGWDFTNKVPTAFSEYFQQLATALLHHALGGTGVVASALFASLVQPLVVSLCAMGVTHRSASYFDLHLLLAEMPWWTWQTHPRAGLHLRSGSHPSLTRSLRRFS